MCISWTQGTRSAVSGVMGTCEKEPEKEYGIIKIEDSTST